MATVICTDGSGAERQGRIRVLLLVMLVASAVVCASGRQSAAGSGSGGKPTVRIGSTNFTEQLIVAELLADSDFLGHHLATTRLRYAARAAVLEDVLRCDGVSFSSPRGGLFVWAHLLGVDTTALLDAALAHNLMFVPGRAFGVDIAWNEHARISFATLPETTLRTAATELVQLAGLRRDLPAAAAAAD